ncbi:transcription factor [Dinochytrium kinnereticum]|nr:transcription factor [Dinochytrium kinnereticum]
MLTLTGLLPPSLARHTQFNAESAAEVLAEKFTAGGLTLSESEQSTSKLSPKDDTPSPEPSSALSPPMPVTHVQAYAKLEGPDVSYFVTKLQVVLGRKASQSSDVDVDLGTSKAISRKEFELVVLGKNGALVNNRYVAIESRPVPLPQNAIIKIGDHEMTFLLPQPNEDQTARGGTKHELDEENAEEPGRKRHRSVLSPQSDDGDGESRPNVSYATMIYQAIISSGEQKKLTLNGIYKWITENYPYYQMSKPGWQNSIRQCLGKSLAKEGGGQYRVRNYTLNQSKKDFGD